MILQAIEAAHLKNDIKQKKRIEGRMATLSQLLDEDEEKGGIESSKVAYCMKHF